MRRWKFIPKKVHFPHEPDGKEQLAAQQDMLARLEAVPPTRRKRKMRGPRPESLAERGARVLAAPDSDRPPSGPWWVARFYYVSEADELLCFHSPPMTYRKCEAAVYGYTRRLAQFDAYGNYLRTDRQIVSLPPLRGGHDAEVVAVMDLPNHPPRHGARLVKLPSQYGMDGCVRTSVEDES